MKINLDDGPYHEVLAFCKFCKKAIKLKIAVSYNHLADPLKLMPLACCDACADNRIEKRRLERKVQLVVVCLELAGAQKTDELIDTSRKQLIKLTQAYTDLIARWHNSKGAVWEPQVVDMIIENPQQWTEVLTRMWQSFREWKRDQDKQTVLPV